jgi:hypothetical protein
MQNVSATSSHEILSEIERRFIDLRQGRPRIYAIPWTLKRQVIEALDSGFSLKELMKATGMSCSAIKLWKQEFEPQVQELNIIDLPVSLAPVETKEALARIVIGSVAIELPTRAIDVSLLRNLLGAQL